MWAAGFQKKKRGKGCPASPSKFANEIHPPPPWDRVGVGRWRGGVSGRPVTAPGGRKCQSGKMLSSNHGSSQRREWTDQGSGSLKGRTSEDLDYLAAPGPGPSSVSPWSSHSCFIYSFADLFHRHRDYAGLEMSRTYCFPGWSQTSPGQATSTSLASPPASSLPQDSSHSASLGPTYVMLSTQALCSCCPLCWRSPPPSCSYLVTRFPEKSAHSLLPLRKPSPPTVILSLKCSYHTICLRPSEYLSPMEFCI